MGSAADYNRATYDRIWSGLSDYIRYNPGARHRRRALIGLLEKCSFASLLDVGCGNAELLRIIDARFPGRRLAGVDLSPAVVEANRRLMPHASFSSHNIEEQELPGSGGDGPFDVVVCSEVIEHLDKPELAVARLARATAVGGHVIVTCPTGKVHATEKHFGHVRHPRPEELTAWGQAAGLEPVDMLVWGFPTYAFTKWATNLRPEMALREFGSERRYGMPQIAISTALYMLNFVNLPSSTRGVQLFARFRRVR